MKPNPGETQFIRLRLTNAPPSATYQPFNEEYEAVFSARRQEADKFYAAVTRQSLTPDHSTIPRQAIAGMLWSKQYYSFDLDYWLDEHGANPFTGGGRAFRNRDWYHMINDDIISMPDNRPSRTVS